MPETTNHMVIHHSNSLHMGVNDSGAQKLESSFFQIFGPNFSLWDNSWIIFQGLKSVANRLSFHPLPHIFGKRTKFFLDFHKEPRVGDGGRDFEPVAHNTRVLHQPGPVLGRETSYLSIVEIFKSLFELFPFVKNNP